MALYRIEGERNGVRRHAFIPTEWAIGHWLGMNERAGWKIVSVLRVDDIQTLNLPEEAPHPADVPETQDDLPDPWFEAEEKRAESKSERF